ncbi:MAG: family 78 glycoside hydrolase catalytic domain, partial [Armatimonadota bacterium]
MNWQAKWIWHPGESAPRNFFWAVRKAFTIPNSFAQVALHITADSRYSVWVNGQYVGHGPVRAFPHRWRYDTYDISPYVCGGENVVAVLVYHFGHSTFQYLQARGGLLAQVECDGQIVAATDSTWKGIEHPAYERKMPRMACQQAWAEAFDARRDLSHWQLAGYDDSTWQNASIVGEVGCAPWKELLPRDIPFLTQEPVQPVRVMRVQAVRPPRQVWTFDLKPNLIPGDLTANPRGLVGLAVTVVECPQPTTFTMRPAYQSGRALRIDGQDISWQKAHEGIPLSPGKHLLVLNVTQSFYHDWFIGLVFDYETGDLRFESPLGDGYPWVTVGPFASEEDPAFKSAWQATSPAQIAGHPAVKPIQPAHTASVNVFGETVYAKLVPVPVRVEDIGALTSANPNDAVLYPADGADVEILVDFGRELVGFFEMELCAPEGTVFDLNAFEYMEDGRIQWTYGLHNTFRYIAREGWQSWRSVVRRGFRYATLTVRFPQGASQPVRLRGLRCYLNTYPYAYQAQFQSSDALLNQIWEISRHTVRLCSEDTFVDCPAYEQTFWVGDARNESLFSYTAFGDARLARRCLLLAGESLWRSPLVESQVPSGWEDILTAWSLLWTVACEEYYRFTGDMEFLKEVYPAVRQQNQNIHERFINGQGLLEIEAWNMLDWAPMDTPRTGVVTHQNMWLVEAWRRSAKMARVLGNEAEAQMYLQWAEELKQAINQHLWDVEKQAYIDCIHADGRRSTVISQQTQTVAYLCDIVPEEKRALFERYLTDVPEDWVRVGSPFMMAFTIEALEKAGDVGRILALIRQWWGMMVHAGATSCWETFPGYL